MASFKKTYTKQFENPGVIIETAEATYWKNYGFPVSVKEFSSINSIDISQVEPHYIAVTTGPKIDIYHQETAEVWRSLTRFHKSAYGGKFHPNGQLLIAGSEVGEVKLFNITQKQLLRIFKGHTGATHCADFIQGKSEVVSFSDDYTVALWDMTDERKIVDFNDHKDFVRTGAASPASPHLVVSGSYDHNVKLWDTRTGSSVATFDQGNPIEALVPYPSGLLIASAGGNDVKVWDLTAGQLLSVMSHHHKTVTCLTLASTAEKTYLLSGSLDSHIIVHDIASYATSYNIHCKAPVFSLALAPQNSTLVVGMLMGSSGLISFQQRNPPPKSSSSLLKKGRSNLSRPRLGYSLNPQDEVFVVDNKKVMLDPIHKSLAAFKFTDALNYGMSSDITRKSPYITVTLFKELIRRSALSSALTGQSAKMLARILHFLLKNIRNMQYQPILVVVTNVLIDIYQHQIGDDSKLLSLFTRLNQKLELDLLVSKNGLDLVAAIEMVMAAGYIRDQANKSKDAPSIQVQGSSAGPRSTESEMKVA